MKKTCTKCKQEKELAEFYKDKKAKDGKRFSCKVCVKAKQSAYSKANPDKVKAKNSAYSKANPDKVKAKFAAYRKANSDELKAKFAAYRKANSEKIKAKQAAYRAYQKEMRELQEEAGFEISDLNQADQC